MSPHEHKPYGGASRKLLLAFDIGTTFSGAAYAVLDPGEVPTIQPIQRYPCQTNETFKIPSVLLYTKNGELLKVGEEACSPSMLEDTEKKGHLFVEWFKLHLCPPSMSSGAKFKSLDIQHKLPPKKTVEQVFADFLAYMFQCSKEYIIESRANGASLWDSVSDNVVVVLTHPNAWEGLQQGKMREAAILAGVIPDTPEGHARLHFVSEGEASLHFCIDAGLTDEFEDGTSAVIIDAGGGTIDSSVYCFRSNAPVTVEETAPAECLLQGSTQVNTRAKHFLKAKFANAGRFGSDDYINAMLEAFDKAAKLTFKDSSEKSFIKFGGLTDKSPEFGIKNGRFSIDGADMAKLFDPAIEAVEKVVRKQKAETAETISFAFLVGGFSANTYLFNRLKALLDPLGICLSRPGQQAHKAVAAGAVSHFIENYVTARVAMLTIGIETITPFDEDDKEHIAREDKIRLAPPGILVIPDYFVIIVPKGKRLQEGDEYAKTVCRQSTNPTGMHTATKDILAYRGNRREPEWMDREPRSFSTLCTVEADTSKVAVMPIPSFFGGVTYLQKFEIVLCCGKTELTAHLRWEEDGVEKCGPATIAYKDDA